MQEKCHEQQHQQQQQQFPDSAKAANAEDIDNHYAGTPIRFLPLHHVYSATSPCVSASGSSNVVSKKVRARKLTLIDGCLDDHHHHHHAHHLLHQHQIHRCDEDEDEDAKNKDVEEEEEELQLKSEPHSDTPQVIRVYSRRQRKKSNSESSNLLLVEKEVKDEPIEDEGFVGDVMEGSPSKKRRVGCSELVKLGVDSSVLSRINGPRLRESRFQYNLSSTKSAVKKKKKNSSVKHKNPDDWRSKKWFQYVSIFLLSEILSLLRSLSVNGVEVHLGFMDIYIV